jgi:integrase
MIIIGKFPTITLTMARDRRDRNIELLQAGINPVAHHGERAAANQASFEALAWNWFEHYSNNGVKEATWKKTESRLKTYLVPALGKLTPASIDAKLVADAIREIGKKTVTTATVAFQDLNMIYSWAISHGRANDNPAAGIRLSDLLPKHETTNRARVEQADVPALMKDIKSYESEKTRNAALLLAHTALRINELVQAQWQEFDLENAVWTVPAIRMKKGREHMVPLTAPVLSILRDLKAQNGHSTFVFPGQGPKHPYLSEKTVLGALGRLGYEGIMTQHGFRGVCSTYLNETLKYPAHVIDTQLSHKVGSKTSNAYNKAQYLDERRAMMADYSNWLETAK